MATRQQQQGWSIVELMVGLALGLIVTAAAVMALTQHLRASRSVLLQARLTHDLDMVAELMSRDLRRTGHWGDAGASVWQSPQTPVLSNPYFPPDDLAEAGGIRFAYSRDAAENQRIDANERFGYRLRRGVIDMQLGDSPWQAMTDAETLVVSSLRITPQVQEIDLAGSCRQACPAGSSTCPRQQVRSLELQIEARSADDPRLTRALTTRVRLRNDSLTGACPT